MYNFHTVCVASWGLTAVKSILKETLFLDQLHDFSFLSLNLFFPLYLHSIFTKKISWTWKNFILGKRRKTSMASQGHTDSVDNILPRIGTGPGSSSRQSLKLGFLSPPFLSPARTGNFKTRFFEPDVSYPSLIEILCGENSWFFGKFSAIWFEKVELAKRWNYPVELVSNIKNNLMRLRNSLYISLNIWDG